MNSSSLGPASIALIQQIRYRVRPNSQLHTRQQRTSTLHKEYNTVKIQKSNKLSDHERRSFKDFSATKSKTPIPNPHKTHTEASASSIKPKKESTHMRHSAGCGRSRPATKSSRSSPSLPFSPPDSSRKKPFRSTESSFLSRFSAAVRGGNRGKRGEKKKPGRERERERQPEWRTAWGVAFHSETCQCTTTIITTEEEGPTDVGLVATVPCRRRRLRYGFGRRRYPEMDSTSLSAMQFLQLCSVLSISTSQAYSTGNTPNSKFMSPTLFTVSSFHIITDKQQENTFN